MLNISPETLTDKHTRAFLERHGDLCAARQLNGRQWLFWILLFLALLIGFNRDFKVAYTVVTFGLCGFYGAVIFFRLLSVVLTYFRTSEHRVDALAVATIPDETLPVYTVLVPMYKEPEVAEKIVAAITHLDYPQDKLDVILLLEEDDTATRGIIASVRDSLPPCVSVIVAPVVAKGEPRTKPRACNWGLAEARGEFLVIYDAEDQPEPDQLKKAVIVFRQLEAAGKQAVACLQAKLNYFNARQNALTRFFTLEYTNWFDLFLPGLHAVHAPIPLGGTSNHFRTGLLKQVGGWDPFNVTEDCDLGMRLTRQGYTTEVLDSTTWEEANSQVPNWIRQRSRWIKGYFQTHLVHTRDAFLPLLFLAGVFMFLASVHNTDDTFHLTAREIFWVKTLRYVCVGLSVCALGAAASAVWSLFARKHRRLGEADVGPWKALTFRFTVGGLSAMLLLNLVFWLMTAAYLGREPLARILPSKVAEIRLDETTTVRQALEGWSLYHANVVDERFAGATLWNTAEDMLRGKLSWKEAREQFDAIDSWSLISQMFFPIAVMLFVANFLFVLLGLLSCQKRKLWELFPYALLMPLYWVLISIAAVKGFKQLFTNPYYWEKTVHGLTHSTGGSGPRPPSAPASFPPTVPSEEERSAKS